MKEQRYEVMPLLNKCEVCGGYAKVVYHYVHGSANRLEWFVLCSNNNRHPRTNKRKKRVDAIQDWVDGKLREWR